MKRTIAAFTLLAVAAVPTPALFAQTDAEIAPTPLEAFGPSSAYAQEVGSLLEDGFFSTSMIRSLAGRENYAATYSIPNQVPEVRLTPGAKAESEIALRTITERKVRLDLVNDADYASQIIVSTVNSRTGTTRNHLVPLEVEASATVEASILDGYDTITLLSLQAFSVHVEARGDGQLIENKALEVLAPRIAADAGTPGAKASPWCQNVNRFVNLCVSGTSSCVIALAKRNFWRFFDGKELYKLDVEFPAGTPFHVGVGTFTSPFNPVCKMKRYRTHQVAGSKNHNWDGTDDMMFNCVPSTATCINGCSGVPSNFDVACFP